MDDQGSNSDVTKVAVGVLLLVAGNFFAVKCFPAVPQIALRVDGTQVMTPDAAGISMSIAQGFKLMFVSLLLLNTGALFLFWSGSAKK